MATAIWPPIDPGQLRLEEQRSLARELEWLLASLQETLSSLKAGLEECAALLSPDRGAFTLALSSIHSESLKGVIVRVGARIVKVDMILKLASLPQPRGVPGYKLSTSTTPQAPTLVLDQLISVRSLVNAALDIIDVSKWTGDAGDANFMSGQLRLLFDHIQEAKHTLKGNLPNQKPWWEDPTDENIFSPKLPSNIAFDLSISEAALQLHIRTLEVVDSTVPGDSFGIRGRLAQALGGLKVPPHDEAGETFKYRGHDVKVREKLRVESQDPSLLAAMAKLSALEHNVAMSQRALDTVMGKED